MKESIMRLSLQAAINELAKCVVLCANCHRNVHAKRIDLRTNASGSRIWVRIAPLCLN